MSDVPNNPFIDNPFLKGGNTQKAATPSHSPSSGSPPPAGSNARSQPPQSPTTQSSSGKSTGQSSHSSAPQIPTSAPSNKPKARLSTQKLGSPGGNSASTGPKADSSARPGTNAGAKLGGSTPPSSTYATPGAASQKLGKKTTLRKAKPAANAAAKSSTAAAPPAPTPAFSSAGYKVQVIAKIPISTNTNLPGRDYLWFAVYPIIPRVGDCIFYNGMYFRVDAVFLYENTTPGWCADLEVSYYARRR
jgi:hypothetical protein